MTEWKQFLKGLLDKVQHYSYRGHSTVADIYVEEQDFSALYSLVSAADSHDRLDLLVKYAHFFPEPFTFRKAGDRSEI